MLSLTLALAACADIQVFAIPPMGTYPEECGDLGAADGCAAAQLSGEAWGTTYGSECRPEFYYPETEEAYARGQALLAHCFPDGEELPGPDCGRWLVGWEECFSEAFHAADAAARTAAGCPDESE